MLDVDIIDFSSLNSVESLEFVEHHLVILKMEIT